MTTARRDEMMTWRATAAERAALELVAESSNTTVSELVRSAVFPVVRSRLVADGAPRPAA